jgi:hypothetical protein
MTNYRVEVPLQAFVHETLESSGATRLPEAELESGITIRRGDAEGDYSAALVVTAASPRAAKRDAIERTEQLLKVIAASNDSFIARIGGVRATPT